MKFTIIPVDKTAVKDGVGYLDLDLSSAGIPANVHALQWQDTSGIVEHTDLTQQTITVLPDWAARVLAIWQAADHEARRPPPEPTTEQLLEQAQALRQAAYTAEADPLFFKWQAGEGLEETWLAKRRDIRARFPYPDEV